MTRDPASSTLRTDRLALRELTENDAPVLAALMDARVSRWLASWPTPCSAGDALEKIRELRAAAARGHAFARAIMDIRTGTIMGMISVVRSAHDPARGEVSYWLGVDFHGAGLMREALSEVLEPAFESLAVDVIEGGGQPANASTFKVMQTLGFRRIADRMVHASSRNRDELCQFYELRRGGAR